MLRLLLVTAPAPVALAAASQQAVLGAQAVLVAQPQRAAQHAGSEHSRGSQRSRQADKHGKAGACSSRLTLPGASQDAGWQAARRYTATERGVLRECR